MIPFWKEADARLAKLDVPKTSNVYESVQWMRPITRDRLHAYQLAVKGLRQDDAQVSAEAMEDLKRIDARVDERIKERSARSK